ncbi:MAG: molybdopterin molybdotransferase MoeA, partial [Methylococcales bacterium]
MEKPKPAPSCTDLNEYGSLRAEQALELILDRIVPVPGREWLSLRAALGRVLTDDVVSQADVPAHTNSAVDGYAVRFQDLSEAGKSSGIRVIETAFAGKPALRAVESGTCIRIMTGAILPEGADTVLMQEHVDARPDDTIRILSKHKPGENTRSAGEDLQKGATALSAGRLLSAADIGLLASLGLGEIRVRRAIRVGILSTGNEVKSIGIPLQESGVFDSNRYT